MTKKYLPPLPDKLPPANPEFEKTAEAVEQEYREAFEEVFTSPKFIEVVAALGDMTAPTGNFWIDRYFAAKQVQRRAAQDGNAELDKAELWDIAAAIEAMMHVHGLSSEQRIAAAVYKN